MAWDERICLGQPRMAFIFLFESSCRLLKVRALRIAGAFCSIATAVGRPVRSEGTGNIVCEGS